MITKIMTEKDYNEVSKAIQVIIKKGTTLGDMELLDASDKAEYIRLSDMVIEYEKIHYPTPIIVNPLVKKIEERMTAMNLKQKEAATLLGISEARMSELLSGKRRVNIRIARSLKDNLKISSDFILDNA